VPGLSPLPFGERVRVRGTCGCCGGSVHFQLLLRFICLRVEGNMRLRWWFRSLPEPCFSVTAQPVNVPGWLNRHHPGNPGYRQRKSPLRGPFVLFLPAIGSGTSLHPCRLCPLGASLRLAPAYRKRLSDFQPDQGAAVSLLFLCDYFIALTFIAPGLVGRVRRSRHPALLLRSDVFPSPSTPLRTLPGGAALARAYKTSIHL